MQRGRFGRMVSRPLAALRRRVPRWALPPLALLTGMSVVLAAGAHHAHVDPVLRTLYFALFAGFFLQIGARHPSLRVPALRWIQIGFFVLTLGHAAAALIRIHGLEQSPVLAAILTALERGGVFLLGFLLISFGIVLWIPALVESGRLMRRSYHRTRGELRTSERTLRRMEQRMVDADRLHLLGELAAGIAHDLRNPLAIVKGAADALAQRERPRHEVQEHAEVIARNVQRAERTIAALLDLARPAHVPLGPVSVDGVFREVLALVAVEARRRGVSCTARPAGGLAVHAEASRLGQVLLNLVMNALQASTAGTELVLRARPQRLQDRNSVAIGIDDRGRGIAPDERTLLFTPFFTTKKDGMGLGLLASRRLVEMLGGRLGLYPRHRGGARALVLLPGAAVPGRPGAPNLPQVAGSAS